MKCIVLDGTETEDRHILEDLQVLGNVEKGEVEQVEVVPEVKVKKVGRPVGRPSKQSLAEKVKKLPRVQRNFAQWTKTEDEFIKENYSRMKKTVLAKRLGRTVLALYARAKKIGAQRKLGQRMYTRGPLKQ